MIMTVELKTKPDTFIYSRLDKTPLPYMRILGVVFEGEQIDIRPEPAEDRRLLGLHSDLAKRLIVALKCIRAGEPMNCHRFSRILTDMQSPQHTHDSESDAISDIFEKNKVATLALGKLGLVGSAEEINGARHSLIGLGENSPHAIQVMSAQGDVGIARYDDILEFYRGSWPNERSADLFRVEV